MDFVDHLEEFRSRILKSCLFFSVLFVIFWFLRDDLLNVYLVQIHQILESSGGNIILLTITDKFFIHLKTVFFFSFVFSFPYFYYQLWQFIEPALFKNERRIFLIVFLFSLLLFYLGALSAYYVLIPACFRFLVDYSASSAPVFFKAEQNVKLALSLGEQIYFTQMTLLLFALVFQTPLVVLCLLKTGLIHAKTIRHYRRHVIVVCFIIAAILTPPDAVSQCLMAVPLIILFEFGLILNSIIDKMSGKILKEELSS